MADSTLALAYYRWIRAANSDVLATRPPADALQKALRYRDRLPENGQRLLNAYHASYHQEDAVEGISLLRGNLTTWPEDIESRALLAELLFLYGRTQGLWQD